MELLMKFIFRFLISAFSLPFIFTFTAACSGKKPQDNQPAVYTGSALSVTQSDIDTQTLLRSLDELAELERAGTWLAGMALTESGIRENAGDFAGSVAAAYKEMAFAYGRGLIQKEDIEHGLSNLLAMKNEETVVNAANAILAFEKEQWATASTGLVKLFDQYDEPDSFASWMILVCALEKDSEDRRSAAAYKAIRARYAQFPEYWYRGARAFSGILSAEYAENCINTSVQGPFANECRKIIATFTGIKAEEGSSIKTKKEIESIITESVNAGNPQLLDPLLPLIGLPENPYTVYAVGALRALTSVPRFKEYFNTQAGVSSGRLAERLSYICRG
jgi:hypothetical protein